MTRWFTSDLHLGHANIIRYCDRPYADVATMDRDLIDRWNDVVEDGDEVWVLGDVAMGQLEASLELIHELAGEKLLVPGNHDRCWPGRGDKAAGWAARYVEAGFAAVLGEQVDLQLGDGDDRRPAIACHFPFYGDSHDEERFAAHRPIDDGRLLLHGHVHTRWRIEGHQVNVGCDVWGYRPVSEAAILTAVHAEERPGPAAPCTQRPGR